MISLREIKKLRKREQPFKADFLQRASKTENITFKNNSHVTEFFLVKTVENKKGGNSLLLKRHFLC